MQYFSPSDPSQFVGDCMPFFHDGVFHLFWLLDEGHHSARGGLGCHQWAHSTSTDLVHWQHHGLAIPITDDFEGSICTGSVFFHDGVFRAFYATRLPDRTEHLSVAVSDDGFSFTKTEPRMFASPGPQYAISFRDPTVFRDPDTGLFHLLVTTSLRNPAVPHRGGCLAHLISSDLTTWEDEEPFLLPGLLGDPECPDYFEWHGWYYLIYSNGGVARYRMSRSPLGPWTRPRVDVFDGPMASVMKTAAFTGDRRLGVAFVPSLGEGRDDGPWLYGGQAVFREIVQNRDGTLSTRWPVEMVPASGEPLPLGFSPITDAVSVQDASVHISSTTGFRAAVSTVMDGVPQDFRLTCRVTPTPGAQHCFGFCLRGEANYERGYELRFWPFDGRVEVCRPLAPMGEWPARAITRVEGIDQPFDLDVLFTGELLDICVDNRRTLICRCPEVKGDRLFVFAHDADVTFSPITLRPLASS